MWFPKGFVFKAGILFASFIFVLGFTNHVKSQCNVAITSFPLEQGFNSSTIPSCWEEEMVNGTASLIYTTSSINPTTTPNEGSHFVLFPAKTLSAGTELRLVSPLLSTTSTGYLNVDFYWYAENNAAYTSPNEGVQVQYSLDGNIWTDIGPFISRHDVTISLGLSQWKNKIVSLPASAMNQSVVYIGFKFRSENGNNIAIDNVKFTTTSCLDADLSTFTKISTCSSSPHYNGTRTEVQVWDEMTDVTYTTKVAGGTTSAGGNTGQGNGSGLSVGFIPYSDTYTVTAAKTGCPDVTTDIYVSIPSIDVDNPFLLGDTLVCSGFNPEIKLYNSQNGVKYLLLLDGSTAGTTVTGNGGHIVVGNAYYPGIYSVNACIEGGGDVELGYFVVRDHLPLPTSENFNSASLGCWTQQAISGSASIYQVDWGYPYIGNDYVITTGNAGSQRRLVSPKLSSLQNPVVNLEFYFYNENSATYSNITEGVQLQYSLDGTTWVDAGPFFARHDPTVPINSGEWRKKTVIFPPDAGGQSSLYIAFKITLAYNDHYVAFDNLSITNTLFPLPVTVEYFKGKINNGNVDLDWKVNCEDATGSSVKFDIERSADGRRFESIHSFTESTNRCLQPFNFRDVNPLPSKSYYRIRMKEMDGKVSFTPIVAVLNKESGFELVSVSPTLVQSATTLHLSVAKYTKLDFMVHDAQGRIVHRSAKAVNAGSHTIAFNFGHLAAGTYQLSAYDANGDKQTIVFLKQ